MYIEVSAIIYAILIGAVILFQFALAAGLPWGSIAMGGKFPGKLPPALRIAALFQIVLLAFLAAIVLSKSGLILANWHSFVESGIWIVVIFSMIAAVLNLITRSKWERRIWAPVSVLMLVTSVFVAIGS